MNNVIRVAFLGDSLMSGCFATDINNALRSRLIDGLRAAHPGTYIHPIARHTNFGGTLGAVYRQWTDLARPQSPEIIFFQGGENEQPGTHVEALGANPVTADQQDIVFAQAPVANQIYRIGTPPNHEWVQPTAINSTTGKSCRRGLFGTTPRNHAGGTAVQNDKTVKWGGDAWITRYQAIVDELQRYARQTGAIVVVGDFWEFASTNTTAVAAIRDVVEGVNLRNFVYAPYTKRDGARIAADATCRGPLGTTTQDLAAADSSTEITLATGDPTHAAIGEYLALVTSALPAYNTTEIVKVTARGASSLTVDRKQLSSSGLTTTGGATTTICKLSHAYTDPATPTFGVTGSATLFAGLGIAYDAHPNDRGHVELGDAFLRAYRNAVGIGTVGPFV